MLGFFAMIVGPRACLQAVGNHCEPVGNDCEPAALLLRNDCEPNQARVCKPASYRLQAATHSVHSNAPKNFQSIKINRLQNIVDIDSVAIVTNKLLYSYKKSEQAFCMDFLGRYYEKL